MIYKFMQIGIPIPEKKMRLNYWLAIPSTLYKLMNGSNINFCCSQRLFSVQWLYAGYLWPVIYILKERGVTQK